MMPQWFQRNPVPTLTEEERLRANLEEVLAQLEEVWRWYEADTGCPREILMAEKRRA